MEQQDDEPSAPNHARPVRIAIVDDHPAVLAGLQREFERMAGHQLVFCSLNGHQFLAELSAYGPVDIAIVDLQMPVLDGWGVLARMREEHSTIKCIAYSFSKDPEWVRRAVAAGARAYVLKEMILDVWPLVVEEVMTTGSALSHWVRECLEPPAVPNTTGWIDRSRLSARKREFLEHLLRPGDATFDEIANLMGVKRSTIDGYMRWFNHHYDIHSREELVRRALLPPLRP
jgi:DNA-binding NarL/FixJ family response regulator